MFSFRGPETEPLPTTYEQVRSAYLKAAHDDKAYWERNSMYRYRRDANGHTIRLGGARILIERLPVDDEHAPFFAEYRLREFDLEAITALGGTVIDKNDFAYRLLTESRPCEGPLLHEGVDWIDQHRDAA